MLTEWDFFFVSFVVCFTNHIFNFCLISSLSTWASLFNWLYHLNLLLFPAICCLSNRLPFAYFDSIIMLATCLPDSIHDCLWLLLHYVNLLMSLRKLIGMDNKLFVIFRSFCHLLHGSIQSEMFPDHTICQFTVRTIPICKFSQGIIVIAAMHCFSSTCSFSSLFDISHPWTKGWRRQEPHHREGREREGTPHIQDLQKWDKDEGDDLSQSTGVGVFCEALQSLRSWDTGSIPLLHCHLIYIHSYKCQIPLH